MKCSFVLGWRWDRWSTRSLGQPFKKASLNSQAISTRQFQLDSRKPPHRQLSDLRNTAMTAEPSNPFNVHSIQVLLPSYLNPQAFCPTVSLQNVCTITESPIPGTSIALPSVSAIKTERDGGTCRGVFEGVKFVLKYAYGTHHFPINCVLLKEEENVYATYLKNVQGNLVPRFYGSFKGEVEDEIHLSCIILEDCGTAVSTGFDQLPFEDRYVHVSASRNLIINMLFREKNISSGRSSSRVWSHSRGVPRVQYRR